MVKLGLLSVLGLALVGTASLAFAGCAHLAGLSSAAPNLAGRSQGRGLFFSTFDISPDGKMIAFSGTGNGGTDLYLLDLTTNKVTQLTNTPDTENYPAFSPDGKSLVYQSSAGANQSRDLYLRSLDGKHIRQLTNTPATNDERPHFSPDGKRIVFSRTQQFYAKDENEWTGSGFDAWVVNRNGGGLAQVTHLNSGGVMYPKFYPDSRHIIFEKMDVSDEASSFSETLAKADADLKEPIQEVVRFSGSDANAFFQPDGKQFVFCGNFDGVLDLYRVSLAGGKPSAILPGQNNTGYCNPIVTADGKSIYCLERYTPNLYKMNIDGSGLHQIADSSLFSDPMHWKPARN